MKKLIVISIFILILFLPLIPQFTIRNGLTGRLVFSGKIHEFDKFYISFIHSVNKTPVNEYYRIEDKKFILYTTDFYSFGAGMPDGSDNPNLELHFNDDGLIQIYNINKEFEKITYYVGTFADHTLHAGNREIRFAEIMEPKSPAEIKLEKVSLLTIIRRLLNER